MDYKSVYIIFIIFIALIGISSVNAEDMEDADNLNLFSQNDEPIEDNLEGAEESQELSNSPNGSFKDLQTEIDTAGDTLNLSRDYSYTDEDSTVEINKKITINGNGHSLDALGKIRIMQINADYVTLNNLTFKNGYFAGTPQNSEAHSAGIYCFGSYSTITNCVFDSNVVANRYGSGAAIYYEDDNGGVHDAIIKNTTFKNNRATDSGGAIFFYGNNILIDNCDFENNSVVRMADENAGHDAVGGAIYFGKYSGSNRTVKNSRFISNYAYAEEDTRCAFGGAIYMEHNVDILNSIFINNSANTSDESCRGGAVYSYSGGNFKNCSFENNSAKFGGAIEIRVSKAKFYACNFTNNIATYGGALFSEDCSFNIKNSNFIHNIASKEAGALYNLYESSVIENSTFKDNYAGSTGGAILFEVCDELTIKSSKFFNNSAKSEAGAIYYWSSGIFTIEDSVFENNTAASAGAIFSGIYYDENEFSVIRSNFTNNRATSSNGGYGGAIYSYCAPKRYVIDSRFIDNYAYNYGGAIYLKYDSRFDTYENVINSSYFENNDAAYGGAVMWYCINGEITDSEFEHNSAKSGSAVYLWYGKLNVSDSSFMKNQANSYSITSNYEDGKVSAEFKGCDNLINAIYNQNQEISFKNVNYWGINGIVNSGSDMEVPVIGYANSNNGEYIYEDRLEANIPINLEIYDQNDNLVKTFVANTGIDGVAYANVAGLAPGNYTVKARHVTDDYYRGTVSDSYSFTIEKADTKIISKNVSGKILTKIDVSVDVLDENNNKVQNGTAILTYNKVNYTAEVHDGIAQFKDVDLTKAGNFTCNITYKGNDYYAPSNGKVNISVLKIYTHTYDHNITHLSPHEIVVVVTVTDEYGHLLESGSVELIVIYEEDKNVLSASPDSVLKEDRHSYFANINNGKAIFDIVLPKIGYYLIDAEYYGNEIYYASEDEVETDIEPENTTVEVADVSGKVGESKTITAKITDQDGNPVYDGKAKLVIGDKEYTTTVKKGIATFENVILPDKNMTGTVYYLGDDNYTESNSTFKITVSADEVSNNESDELSDEELPDQDSEDDVGESKDTAGDSLNDADVKKAPVAKSVSNATGNPLFALLIVLITLVCNFGVKRRK